MSNQSKLYAIRNKSLANGLHWLTGQRFYIMDSEEDSNIKTYTFERTDKLNEALSHMSALKKELNKE